MDSPVRRLSVEDCELAYQGLCRDLKLDPDSPRTVALIVNSPNPMSAEAAARRAAAMVGGALATFDAETVAGIRSAAGQEVRPSANDLETKAALVVSGILDASLEPVEDGKRTNGLPPPSYEVQLMAAREGMRLVEIAHKRGVHLRKTARGIQRPRTMIEQDVRQMREAGIEVKFDCQT